MDGRTACVLRRSARPDPSLGSGPQEHECFEANKEIVITDYFHSQNNLYTVPKQTPRANRSESWRGRKRSLVYFIIASFLGDLKQTLLDLLKEFKEGFGWRFTEMPRFNP